MLSFSSMWRIRMIDIAIIGSGPAGMSAAVYAARAGRETMVFEGGAYGGQIITTPELENYPALSGISGFELAENMFSQMTEAGAKVVFESVSGLTGDKENGFELLTDSGARYLSRAVIICAGAKSRSLGLQGEEKLVGRGVSFCATCDGNFYKGRDVAVVGGGNTAVEDACCLSSVCRKVYLIHRRDSFRAHYKEVEKLSRCGNVEIILSSVIDEIITSEDSLGVAPRVAGLRLHSVKTGEERVIEAAALFEAVGQIPAQGPWTGLVECDTSGYIVAGEDCRSSVPGVYAAGDIRTKAVRQVVTAASDGAVAALVASGDIG